MLWKPTWAIHDTITKGILGHMNLWLKTINQPSYSGIEIVNPAFHKHSTRNSKFMETH